MTQPIHQTGKEQRMLAIVADLSVAVETLARFGDCFPNDRTSAFEHSSVRCRAKERRPLHCAH